MTTPTESTDAMIEYARNCEDGNDVLGRVNALHPPQTNDVPKIVCLCGSTRFYEQFMEATYLESMVGNIVLSVAFFMHRADTQHGQVTGCTPQQKIALDELHKRKIDLCDEVFVLNVCGYIGNSTRSEIEYAVAARKPIRYLEAV